MAVTAAEILQDIEDYILTGGRRTRADKLRMILDKMVELTEQGAVVQPDGVITGCAITLGSYPDGKNVRVAEGEWIISEAEYSNVGSGNTDFLVVLSASGLQRYVDFVGTTSNTIIKIEGSESEVAVRPSLSLGQVSLGSILVKDAEIDPPVIDLSGYLPLAGGTMTGNLNSSNPVFQIGISDFSRVDYYHLGDINRTRLIASNFSDSDLREVTFEAETTATTAKASIKAVNFDDSSEREFHFLSNGEFNFNGDIAVYDADRTTEIDSNGLALINRDYALSKFAVTQEFDLTFDGVEDTFTVTHGLNNDKALHYTVKTGGSLRQNPDDLLFSVSSNATTLTVQFVVPPSAGTGYLTVTGLQKEAIPPGSGIGTGIIGSTFIVA